MKCPECRAEHRIPYNGIQGFPTNYTLQKFLELHADITGNFNHYNLIPKNQWLLFTRKRLYALIKGGNDTKKNIALICTKVYV